MFILVKPIFLLLIAACLILSIYVKEKHPLNMILPFFFGTLLFVESLCYYLKTINTNNLIIYNLWFPIEFIMYSIWLVIYSNSNNFKKLFSLLIPIYAVTVIIIYSFTNTLYKFNSLAFQFGFLLLLPAILYTLYEYMEATILNNPLRVPIFWLTGGLLTSYVFSLSEFSIQNYLHVHNKELLEVFKKINIILTDILYVSIIIYFILKWKNRKSHISFTS